MQFTDFAIPNLILILKFALEKKEVEDCGDAMVDCSEQFGPFSFSKKQDISLAIYSRKIVYAFS
jgi:hypothetical protein